MVAVSETRMASCGMPCGSCKVRFISQAAIVCCTTCDEGLCSVCLKHHKANKASRKHNTIPISQYTSVESSSSSIKQKCEKHDQDDRKQNIDAIEDDKKTITTEVKLLMVRLHKHLDKMESSIFKDLDTNANWHLSVIDQLLSKMKEKQESIQQIGKIIKQVKGGLSDVQSFLATKHLRAKLSEVENWASSICKLDAAQGSTLTLKTNQNLEQTFFDMKSYVENQVVRTPCQIQIGAWEHKRAQISVPTTTIRDIDKIQFKLECEIKLLEHCLYKGCIIVPDGKMVFATIRNDQLSVHRKDGKLYTHIAVGCHPNALAMINNNTIAALCSTTRSINIVDIHEGIVEKRFDVGDECHGLFYYNNKLYFLVMKKGIRPVDLDGHFQSDISVEVPTDTGCLSIDKNKIFYTSNGHPDHRFIACYDFSGNQIWRSHFANNCVAVDPFGNCFATQLLSPTLKIISMDGKRERHLITDSETVCMMASCGMPCGSCKVRFISQAAIVCCTTCDEGLCSVCLKHHKANKASRKHNTIPISQNTRLEPIEELARHANQSIDLLDIERGYEELRNSLEELKNNRKQNIDAIEDDKKTITTEVKLLMVRLHKHLDKMESSIFKDLDTNDNWHLSVIDQLLSKMKEKQESIQQIGKIIKQVKGGLSDVQSFLATKHLRAKLSEVENWASSICKLDAAQGSTLTLKTNQNLEQTFFDMKSYVENQVVRTPCQIQIGAWEHKRAQISVPTTTIRDIDKIQFKLEPVGCHPNALAMINNNTIAALCSTTRSINIVDIHEGIVEKRFDVRDECHGLFYYNNKLYILVMKKGIHPVDLDGHFQSDISVEVPTDTGCLSMDKNKIFYTSNGHPDHRFIACYDFSGNQIWRSHFANNCVAVDPFGNCFATQLLSPTLKIISMDGKRERHLITDSETVCMYFDKNNNALFVTSRYGIAALYSVN
ncbi:unnamed protein product [Mytilus coruscus]|uniref:B box-type domain-containing protein n=1 Tax=Mytilus coruscus TaxID=42192 RepID=A0A6J8BKV2_MYTCO|nr:unnamed protein product [Mytilus coruscus]